MTLSRYVARRLGKDWRAQARNFFAKPFGAPSFRQFWWYWNPVFGYYLYYYSYKPLRAFLPHWAALWVTFLFCGLLHDLPFGLVAVARGTQPPATFTVLFVLFGLLVVLSEHFKLRFEKLPMLLRWGVHASAIYLCWYCALLLTTAR